MAKAGSAGPRDDNAKWREPGALATLVSRAKDEPFREFVVTRHATYSSARSRAESMRRSRRWGMQPLTYRARRLDPEDQSEGVLAVVTARLRSPNDAPNRFRFGWRLLSSLMSDDERVRALADIAMGRDYDIPPRLIEEYMDRMWED